VDQALETKILNTATLEFSKYLPDQARLQIGFKGRPCTLSCKRQAFLYFFDEVARVGTRTLRFHTS
jgi:hypothetical protein